MSQPWTHVAAHSPAYPRVDEHYVEPHWCSERLFAKETFKGGIYDPACGFGRILESAKKYGHVLASGNDIADRGQGRRPQDFFQYVTRHDNIISNPPFDQIERFAKHALNLARKRVALIMPTARLNAARWLENTPLQRIWLLTPRPSMPPGHVIKAGGKVGGGKSDYCWLVFDHDYRDRRELKWLHRDET